MKDDRYDGAMVSIQLNSDICTHQPINITLARTANKLQNKIHEWTTEKNNQSTVKK